MRTTGTGTRRVTVVLACTASGKTLPLMIIFKLYLNYLPVLLLLWYILQAKHQLRVIKGLSGPPGFVLAFQKNGWMDAVVMQQWVKEIWLKYTEKHESLLTLDTFSAHLENEVM